MSRALGRGAAPVVDGQSEWPAEDTNCNPASMCAPTLGLLSRRRPRRPGGNRSRPSAPLGFSRPPIPRRRHPLPPIAKQIARHPGVIGRPHRHSDPRGLRDRLLTAFPAHRPVVSRPPRACPSGDSAYGRAFRYQAPYGRPCYAPPRGGSPPLPTRLRPYKSGISCCLSSK